MKHVISCFVLMVCIIPFTHAQNEKRIDSLIRVIPTVPNDRMETHVYAFLHATSGLSPSDALQRNQQAIDVCKRYNRPYALIRFQLHGAWIRGNVEEAYQWHKKMIQYAEFVNDSSTLMQARAAMGNFQFEHNLRDEGFSNILIAMEIAQKTKSEIQHFNFKLTLVSAYFNAGDYEKAREAGHEILQLYATMNEPVKIQISHSMMSVYNTIGLNFSSMGRYDSALHYLELSRQMAHDAKDGAWEALTIGNKGSIYFKLGRYEQALPDLLYDTRHSQENRSWGSAVNAMIMISDIHLIKGNSKMASTYLDSSLYLHKKYAGDAAIPTNYWKSLSNLEFARGNYVLARKAQDRYTEQKVESIKKQGTTNLAKIKNSFDLKTKQTEIDALTESAAIREKQLTLQRYALVAAVVALLLALALVVNFIYNYRRQKRINAIIQKHQQETERTNEELRAAYQNLQMTQNQLVQTEKMAFLGRLTSGIAHEINTPLGAIKASAENSQSNLETIKEKIVQVSATLSPQHAALVLELISQPGMSAPEFSYAKQRERKKACTAELRGLGIEKPESMVEYVLNTGVDLDYTKWMPLLLSPQAYELFRLINRMFSLQTQNANIVMAVNKASKILFALKMYSHPGNDSSAIDVNLIENVEMVLAIYTNNLTQAELIRNFDEVPLIKGFPEELSQVWTNSIHNSLQAMNGSGKLTIVIGLHNVNEVKVEIADNGAGITPENQKRLFEPFFTTKSAGEGTGLGLSIIKKIVEKHKGRIECESELNRGTTFRFIFPLS